MDVDGKQRKTEARSTVNSFLFLVVFSESDSVFPFEFPFLAVRSVGCSRWGGDGVVERPITKSPGGQINTSHSAPSNQIRRARDNALGLSLDESPQLSMRMKLMNVDRTEAGLDHD